MSIEEVGLGPDVASPDVVEPDADAAYEAIAAVRVGLYVSAVRCLFTYVVAPIAGAFGILFGPSGVLLLLLGSATSVAGARRLWLLRHRARLPYAVVAFAVCALAAVSLTQLIAGAL